MSKRKRMPRAPRVVINVTPEHIDTAIPKDSGHCMIADAVRDSVSGARSVSVDLQSIRFTDKNRNLRYVYLTPRIAQAGLIDFDLGRKPEPCSFELRNGHVLRANKRSQPPDERIPSRAILVSRDGPKNSGGSIPERVGGKAPPAGALSNRVKVRTGKRREFGLRSLIR